MSTGLLIIVRHKSRGHGLVTSSVAYCCREATPPILARRPLPEVTFRIAFPSKSQPLSSALTRTVFCEVEVNFQTTLPEFDPEFNPIGYALAFELHDNSTSSAIAESQLADDEGTDRFGWEYNPAA